MTCLICFICLKSILIDSPSLEAILLAIEEVHAIMD